MFKWLIKILKFKWLFKFKWFIKLLEPLIEQMFFKMFDHQAKVYKFKKSLDYMELPNEADRGVEKLKVASEMAKGQMKDMVNDINKIKNILNKVKKIRSL